MTRMKRMLGIGAVVLAALGLAACKPEVEPNDTAAQVWQEGGANAHEFCGTSGTKFEGYGRITKEDTDDNWALWCRNRMATGTYRVQVQWGSAPDFAVGLPDLQIDSQYPDSAFLTDSPDYYCGVGIKINFGRECLHDYDWTFTVKQNQNVYGMNVRVQGDLLAPMPAPSDRVWWGTYAYRIEKVA